MKHGAMKYGSHKMAYAKKGDKAYSGGKSEHKAEAKEPKYGKGVVSSRAKKFV
jgi:hypothetical protein